MTRRLALLAAGAALTLGIALLSLGATGQRPADRADAGTPPPHGTAPGDAADYRKDWPDSFRYYGPNRLWKDWSETQRQGRDTWIFWTGGNQKFLRLATVLGGRKSIPVSIEYFRMLDSRNRGTRFQQFGLINEPNCVAAKEPDPETGLWLDVWNGDPYSRKKGADTKYGDGHFDKGDYPYYPDPNDKVYAAYYGEPTGVVGLRKFRNPKFWDDPAAKKRWLKEGGKDEYFKRPWAVEPPYYVGFSCAFCHMSFDPTNPPKDPENPRWENLAANMGNQYLREGDFFLGRGRSGFGDQNPGPKYASDPYDTRGLDPTSLLFQYAVTQQPGTSETSRISYDFINNPNTINAIFNLGNRPLFAERAPDGKLRAVNHVLKDGADSVGIEMALLRVWINIGCEGRYWVDTLYNPGSGQRQRPLGIDDLRLNFRADDELTDADKKRRHELRAKYGPDVGKDWEEAHRRNPALLAYLASYTPYHLKDVPEGKKLLLDATKTDDKERLDNGKKVFAAKCAACHSSKQPMYSLANTPKQRDRFFFNSVNAPDFLEHNTLSDDVRYSVTRVDTNMARALATNAVDGDVWAELSSKDYKALPPVGRKRLVYGFDGKKIVGRRAGAKGADDDVTIDFTPPGGGRGYYRTPSLVSLWATAPYFHNNALGDYYVTKTNGDKGWISNDGTRWRKDKDGKWESRDAADVGYRIDVSVAGRLLMFQDGIEKLLWPEKRDYWIKRTQTDCHILDLKPLFELLLPGVLADLLFEFLEEEAKAKIAAYFKDKDLPPAAREALENKVVAAARAKLNELRKDVKPEDLPALKQKLVEFVQDQLLKAAGDAAGADHAEALRKALAGLDKLFAEAADRVLNAAVLTVPAGTPINLYFNLNAGALPYAVKAHVKYRHDPRKLAEELLKLSDCPDLVEDKGHEFGANDLTDQQKKDLIEFLKTL